MSQNQQDERVNPFADIGGDSLDDFKPKDKSQEKPTPTRAQIDQLSQEAGFPSRQPGQKPAQQIRRYRTGRNQQLNVKVDQDTFDLFYELCDDMPKATQGEILNEALLLLRAKNAEEGRGG